MPSEKICSQDFANCAQGAFVTLKEGHVYLVKNRCGEGAQVIDFLRIENGQVDGGIFSQELLEVVADRMAWQAIHSTSAFEETRQRARRHVLAAVAAMAEFSKQRKDAGIDMIGHSEKEFI